MPIYEYQCSSCGHRLETIQKISDAPLTNCPACKKDDLKKLVSASSFRLKGGGWYETDFKKDNKRHIADSGDSDKSGSSDKSGNSDKRGTEAAKDTKPSAAKEGASAKPSGEKPTKTKTNTSK